MKSIALSALTTVLAAHLASAASPLIVDGSDFVNSVTEDRFVMVGLAYQPAGASGYDPNSGVDPLSDADACLRDAAVMQKLGVNTIRVYNINPALNHDECVSIFNAVGIYLALDVNSPLSGESLNRDDPASSYHSGYLTRIFSVVEAFKDYPNLLGFFAGNEVVNSVKSAQTVPQYIRAIQRDLKQYIAAHASRTIPVGYSAADDDTRRPMWAYLTCGDDADSRADFYGLNSYQWCGDSTWETSGYQGLVTTFSNTSVPLFFSEFGCNTVRPRPFNEIAALYGDRMIDSWSGGLVYEYTQEPSDYGLVEISSDGDATLLEDFDNLQKQYNGIDITLITSRSSLSASASPPTCSDKFILQDHAAKFNTSMDIPACPDEDLLTNGVQNANKGKIVELTEFTTPHKVYTSGGAEVANLTITPLADDQSNTPSGETTSGAGNNTGNGTAAADDAEGVASSRSVGAGALAVAAVVAVMAAFV
ncbi:uncharacterized protein LAJ45_01357 [Morchella importuna]|uniref:1,3-beta-glucanosyltransferase n=1 Tax=Morchella conica CCBAS932 TaxID=1392247 RepID=A0A3N4KB20_9PEZI|nr:uncharacterized protein LAJ45_01357 [Morchella importuna]KAH8154826.1 hypothetical protein LAJ45_01357 [Morchella importuna]RPB07683.1 hypothetical protein P167DRAFT_568458 [Morchella conica CCBAS932]